MLSSSLASDREQNRQDCIFQCFSRVFDQFQEWLERKKKYLCSDVQNEMLKIMRQNILRSVASNIQSTEFVSVMMDECTDSRNNEQVNANNVISNNNVMLIMQT